MRETQRYLLARNLRVGDRLHTPGGGKDAKEVAAIKFIPGKPWSYCDKDIELTFTNGETEWIDPDECVHLIRASELTEMWLRTERHRAQSLVELNERLLAAAAVEPGHAVVEVGAGTGELTAPLAERVGCAGSVVALEPLPPMLAALKSRVTDELTHVSVRAVTGEDAELPKATFDGALGRYVLMLLADPVTVLRKLLTSLKVGGRAGMAVFAARADNAFFGVPLDILARHARTGAPPPDRMHSLGDPARLRTVFVAAGFVEVQVESVTSSLRFESVKEAGMVLRETPTIDGLLTVLGSRWSAAWRDVETYLASLSKGSTVVATTRSLVVSGVAR